jgi:small subunit ribosomal protein S6
MNIECDQPTLDEISSMFKFSDAVLRNLIMRRDSAVTAASPLLDASDDGDEPEVSAPVAESTPVPTAQEAASDAPVEPAQSEDSEGESKQ